MRVELTIDIPCKNETKRLECITKNITAKPEEVIDILNEERLLKPSMQCMRVCFGKQKCNTFYMETLAINIDCLSLKEIQDLLIDLQYVEFRLKDKLNRDCGRDKPRPQVS